ncbi:recombinase family protein [Burkholderia cenocepacia]|uniref:recombinase family protein n=1 Tax=Burkholderia cenocepacia TaxID=95486 RepID=UPI002230909F|nr:recombinase family protein [Burkholderia cenocepacia]MCW3502074.1 recombinase family protein [Burkholderia cenocepacia]MCW3509456.1 recombinase family protein [Burkholderia cenocepacia]MCW3517153.1 recombinase family protein [Burkholderia cenocepacia]MCW3532638.1 recombinase family protein [Burkholderia cenocepacia]MCW3547968.1 recombinase family protein [Burkholderia cenocepacia]
MSNTEAAKPVAYSYIRFSTAQQALGDSLRRQVELTEQYCDEHGLVLARASAYRDLGVSAFRKKNIEAGKLAEFISAVKSGKVSPGSYLIVEQFDRLSRAEVNVALRLFLDLVDAGIVVVTLADKKVWDKQSVADVGDLITAIIYMSRANDESERKSDRLSAVWQQKKKRAADGTATRIVTSEAPRWLRANTDKTGFDVVPELADSVRRVFEMRINGAGVVAICRRANQERWPLPGKMPVRKLGESDEDFSERRKNSGQWHQSLVARILKNRAVLGEYQPRRIDSDGTGERVPVGEPIQGYFPPIIDEATFLSAQATALRRGVRPGRRDPHARNWLYGLVKCGACGNSLVRKNKTSTKQPGYSRYYCVARVRGATKCPSVSSAQLEGLVSYVATSWLPANWSMDASLGTLKAHADALELEIATLKKNIDGLADLAGGVTTASARKSLIERLDAEGDALDAREQELARVRAELADRTSLGGDDDVHQRLQQVSREIDAFASGNKGLDSALRMREELARIFQKVVVHHAEGYIELFIKGRAEPVWLPLDFVSLEQPSEPTAEQLEAAERDVDALRQAMTD